MEILWKIIIIIVSLVVGAFLLYGAGRLFGKGYVESLKIFFKHKGE